MATNYMRQRVPQRDPSPLAAELATLFHVAWRETFERPRPGGVVRHFLRKREGEPPHPPVTRDLAGGEHLRLGLARQQGGANGASDRLSTGNHPETAASTSSACPFTFTLSQTRSIRPSAPTR